MGQGTDITRKGFGPLRVDCWKYWHWILGKFKDFVLFISFHILLTFIIYKHLIKCDVDVCNVLRNHRGYTARFTVVRTHTEGGLNRFMLHTIHLNQKNHWPILHPLVRQPYISRILLIPVNNLLKLSSHSRPQLNQNYDGGLSSWSSWPTCEAGSCSCSIYVLSSFSDILRLRTSQNWVCVDISK